MKNGAMLRLAAFTLVCLAVGTARGQTILYVDDTATGSNDGSSWCDAYLYLQDALAAASAPAEIRVAQGIYNPDQGISQTPGDRNATFQLLNGVAIKGGYAGCGEPEPDTRNVALYDSILSGDLNGDDGPDFFNSGDNSCHVMTGSGTDETAVLDGVAVVGGNITEFCDTWSGAGMQIIAGSPTLSSCTFRGNRALYYDGGGIYNDTGSPTLTDCAFTGNYADYYGGGMCNLTGSPTLINCTFSGNGTEENEGGGMYNDAGSPMLVNCVFRGNYVLANSGGGIYNNSGAPILTNCTLVGNSSSSGGGGMGNSSGTPTLTNCTFLGNDAYQGGGLYNRSDGQPTLVNSIFWDNTDNGGMDESAQIQDESGILTVNHTCVQGWTGGLGGSGNIGDEPLFLDANGPDNVPGTADDNLRLSSGSPCIDAADNLAIPPDTLDLDNDGNTAEPTPIDLAGRPRFVDDPHATDTGTGTPPIVDMGAYEYLPPIYVDDTATGANDGSSWYHAYIYLQDALAAAAASGGTVDEIRVGQGIYKPDQGASQIPGDREATFQLLNGVAIKGGYAGFGEPYPNTRNVALYETTLSGDLNGDDDGHLFDPSRDENSCHVMTGSGTDETAVLDGVAVVGGNASYSIRSEESCVTWDGGGMYNDTGSPTLTRCTFRWNQAFNDGGGIYNNAGNSTLKDCTFIENSAGYDGGGICNLAGNLTLIGCIFSGNYADETNGAGLFSAGASPTLTNCVFNNNQVFNGAGGAMYHGGGGNPVLTNCIFFGNKGAGISLGYGLETAITIDNCILWGNFSIEPFTTELLQIFYQSGTPDPFVSHSCIEGLDTLAGNNNIGNDPLFVNPRYWIDNTPQDPWDDVWAGGDYHLQDGSPCIDAADNAAVPPDALDIDNDGVTDEPVPLDLDGNPRFVDDPLTTDTGTGAPPMVDMGAYEFLPPIHVDDTATGANDGTNWCDAYIYVQDALAAAAASGGTVGEIRVAQGIYKPDQGAGQTPGDRDATFQLLDGVPVKGGYAGCGAPNPDARHVSLFETILSGDLSGDDGPDFANNDENSIHVVSALEADATTVIDGFTIAYGNANGSHPDESGGGLHVGVPGNITIRDCRFHSNAAATARGRAHLLRHGQSDALYIHG